MYRVPRLTYVESTLRFKTDSILNFSFENAQNFKHIILNYEKLVVSVTKKHANTRVCSQDVYHDKFLAARAKSVGWMAWTAQKQLPTRRLSFE